MALINPCNLSVFPSNTGVECSSNLKATAAIWMVPKNWKDTMANITAAGGLTAYALDKVHAAPALRWFPVMGAFAPIRSITDSNETDVIETLEDGSMKFIRYGVFNRTFTTTEGGLCLAQALSAMRDNYAFIEVDIISQVAMMLNSDGTYSGFPTNLAYSPVPTLANLKTSYKNNWMMSFLQQNYIQKGKIFKGDGTEDMLDVMGLIDVDLTLGTGTQSTTHIFFKVKTECAETDLAELYPGTGAGALAQVANFIVLNAGGTPIVPSAATITNGEVDLTGVYPTGTNITVDMVAPSVLKTNGIEGYESTGPLTIAIP
jgi:hypothetical protein